MAKTKEPPVTHRGIEMPKPYGSGSSWVINDGRFGYVTGRSKDFVMQAWKSKVDGYLLRDRMDSGDYVLPWVSGLDLEEAKSCTRCGSLVTDIFRHDDWHSIQG